MTFPTPHTVTHIPFLAMGQDGLGNDAPTFSTPVQRRAYAYQPHKVENTDGHTSQVVADVDLSMPTTTVNLLDRFTVAGDLFEVVGLRDNNGGFHGWAPGIVVELKRVTG